MVISRKEPEELEVGGRANWWNPEVIVPKQISYSEVRDSESKSE